MKRRSLSWILTAAAVVALLFISAPGMFVRAGALCDGAVPAWYPSEGGCSEIPSLVEHLWPPARWDAPTFCQGLCLGGLEEVQRQSEIVSAWRAAHPDALAH